MSENMVTITVDNKKIEAREGDILLKVCLENDIYIPNLCYLPEIKEPPVSCRLCFVEIEGYKEPVNSCSIKVSEGMVVKTDTYEVRKLQKWGFELILSIDKSYCRECIANHVCELQRIANFLNVPLRPEKLPIIERDSKIDYTTHPHILYDYKKCVLCGRCVYICSQLNKKDSIDFGKRGYNTIITFFVKKEISDTYCKGCLKCVEVCPVGALQGKDKDKMAKIIKRKEKKFNK
jgi:formate dehydrogenase major subunit/NADH-quinone oxidoreductase subunit G